MEVLRHEKRREANKCEKNGRISKITRGERGGR